MRIAVIPTIRNYPWGAPGHCMGSLVGVLLDAGHSVRWYVAPIDWEHADVARLVQRGAAVALLPDFPSRYGRLAAVRRWMRSSWDSIKPIESTLLDYDPDHVFINQGGTWCALEEGYFDYLRANSGNYSLICHLNQYARPFAPEQLSKAQALMDGAKRVFFPSKWTRDLAEAQIAHTIYRASYFQNPVRYRFESPLPWPSNEIPRLAMVGRLDSFHKGIDLAFAAFAKLIREGMRAELHLYGDGEDRDYLQSWARFLGIPNAVVFHGHVANVDEIWLREELLLAPSRFEGCAVSMTEAMGFGRPVVTTAVGGAREWVEDGQNGYICAAPEPDLLTQVLRRALSERANWREMGLTSHRTIKSRRDPSPAKVFLEALA
jgi:glycosyltransferase involved in cell wall biosynthesis